MKPNDNSNNPNNLNNSPEVQVVPRLRRVVDMSEINAQKAKTTTPKTHRSEKPGTHAQDARASKVQHTQTRQSTNPPQTASTSSPEQDTDKKTRHVQRAVRSESAGSFNSALDSQDMRPKQPRRNTANSRSLYEAKTTRLFAPETPLPQKVTVEPVHTAKIDAVSTENMGSAQDNSISNASRKERTLSARPKLIPADNKQQKIRRDKYKSTNSPIKQIKAETELRLQKVQEHITESLLLQSWRSKQWGATIAMLGNEFTAMLPKCMPLVQARLVNDVCIAQGRLEATIVDQIATIELRQFTLGQWRAVINMLSDRAIFTPSLLNGELPEGNLEIFKQASLSLFPTKMREFTFSCTCGCENALCEHICALLLAFSQSLEEDPFNILTLRGMNKERLLSLLRDARSDQVVDEKSRHHINYEMPAQNANFNDFYTPKGDFSEFAFHIAFTPNTLIKRLGAPSAWSAPFSFDSTVSPLIEQAAHDAENLGLSEHYQLELSEEEFKEIACIQEPLSRAPRKSSKAPKFTMPDMSFITTVLSPEILETIPDNPIATAEDIIRWLKTKGASDIRTLARRTRLHKPTIEAFLNAFCDAGLAKAEGEPDKLRFEVTF